LKTSEPSSPLAGLIGNAPGGEAAHLSAALQQGDAAAVRILNEFAEDLAFGLSHAVHLFHPQIIVLGGGLSNVGEPLQARVRNALTGFIMEAFRPGPEIVLSKLGEDAVTVGALVLGGVASASRKPKSEGRRPKAEKNPQSERWNKCDMRWQADTEFPAKAAGSTLVRVSQF